jgi:hypothetical protein
METLYETQAATYLGRPPATLRSWRHDGPGPRFEYRKARVVYLKSDLDRFKKGYEPYARAQRRSAP